MTNNLFPIIPERGAAPHPLRIPWSVAELAYSVYAGKYGTGQSLKRLAERGGFYPSEMDEFLPDWRTRCDQLRGLKAAAEVALSHVEELRDAWMRGAIEERDGLGGTRSNRNVEVEVQLRKALGEETT